MISQSLEEGEEGPRTRIPIAIIKEIVLARAQGRDSAKICEEYNVDPSVVRKLENHIAIPVNNADGIVHSSIFLSKLTIGSMATEMRFGYK